MCWQIKLPAINTAIQLHTQLKLRGSFQMKEGKSEQDYYMSCLVYFHITSLASHPVASSFVLVFNPPTTFCLTTQSLSSYTRGFVYEGDASRF